MINLTGLKAHELFKQLFLEAMPFLETHFPKAIPHTTAKDQGDICRALFWVDFQPAGGELAIKIPQSGGSVLDGLAQCAVLAVVQHIPLCWFFRQGSHEIGIPTGWAFNGHLSGTNANGFTGLHGQYQASGCFAIAGLLNHLPLNHRAIVAQRTECLFHLRFGGAGVSPQASSAAPLNLTQKGFRIILKLWIVALHVHLHLLRPDQSRRCQYHQANHPDSAEKQESNVGTHQAALLQ